MKTFLTFLLLQLLATCCLLADNDKNWRTAHDVSYANIDGYYLNPKDEHKFAIGLKNTIDTLGYDDYSMRFYVDTAQHSFSFENSILRYSRIEFFYKDTKIATFDSDECWMSVPEAGDTDEPKMYVAHKLGNDLAIILHGGLWMGSPQSFNVFILHDNKVSVVYSKPNQIQKQYTEGDKTIYRCMCELEVSEAEGEYSEAKYSTITIDSQSINVTYDSDKVEKRVYTVNKYKNVKSVGNVTFNGLSTQNQVRNNAYGCDIPWKGGNKEVSISFHDLVMESYKGEKDTFPEMSLEMFRKYFPDVKIDISINSTINDAYVIANYKDERWDRSLQPYRGFQVAIDKQTAGGVILSAGNVSKVVGGDHPKTDIVHTLGFVITATSKYGTTVLLDQDTPMDCIPLVQMVP